MLLVAPKMRGLTRPTGLQRKHQGPSGGGGRESTGQSLYWCSCGKGSRETAQGLQFGSFQEALGLSLVVQCLDLGWSRVGVNWRQLYESKSMLCVVLGTGSGLLER